MTPTADLARTLHQKETCMGKAFQGEAVVNLPRVLNPPSLFELWRASNSFTD